MAQKTTSKEFEERKALIELQRTYDREKHEFRMKELEFARESEKIHHENEMTRQRIKSAEIRKTQMRRGSGYNY